MKISFRLPKIKECPGKRLLRAFPGNEKCYSSQNGNRRFQPPLDLLDREREAFGMAFGLLRDTGNVDKAALCSGKLGMAGVEDTVHDVVADIGSGGIGNGGRKSRRFDRLFHLFDRKERKDPVRAARNDRLLIRLEAGADGGTTDLVLREL